MANEATPIINIFQTPAAAPPPPTNFDLGKLAADFGKSRNTDWTVGEAFLFSRLEESMSLLPLPEALALISARALPLPPQRIALEQAATAMYRTPVFFSLVSFDAA